MNAVAFAASAVVGVAFVVAGGSKLAAGRQWPVQAAELGAPRWAIPIVPWIELSLGAALIAQLWRPLPAVVAIVMLLVFTGLIARRLAEGKRPVCACFGAWSATPIGPTHLARNSVLAFLAMIALWA